MRRQAKNTPTRESGISATVMKELTRQRARDGRTPFFDQRILERKKTIQFIKQVVQNGGVSFFNNAIKQQQGKLERILYSSI
jgi:hypothetical protein